MAFAKSLMVAVLASQAIAMTSMAGEPTGADRAPPAAGRKHPSQPAEGARLAANPLDRVAEAVDNAESSHGKDVGMWRLDPSGPQGPMQVSEAAATDVGGGDRFDLMQNRAIGRAYLSQLFGRYGNWPDAIAAYNWGLGKMDAWVKAGRPPDKFVAGVAVYLRRVLQESGLCNGSEEPRAINPAVAKQAHPPPPDWLAEDACLASGPSIEGPGSSIRSSRFHKKLDAALQFALQRAAQSR